jgi:hypothetical protein
MRTVEIFSYEYSEWLKENMNTELKEYFKIKYYCPANGTHDLVVLHWPFVICRHCDQEFMLLSREMIDRFFEIKFFEKRLSS